MVALVTEQIKPGIGAILRADRAALREAGFASACLELLDRHGVLVFPEIGLGDEEQLALTDSLGSRVNFTQMAKIGDLHTPDVYTVTLDPRLNPEPEYVRGTFFWHMDGLTVDIAPPFASVLSCRTTSPRGGQTEFANTMAAFDALAEEDKAELRTLRVVHSVVASVREVVTPDRLDETRRAMRHEHPLIWTHASGRESLLIGYTADYVVGRPRDEGRALLMRLLEWTAQPAFSYLHQWRVDDLVVWNNCGALHRVIPYAVDSGRAMRRTSVAALAA